MLLGRSSIARCDYLKIVMSSASGARQAHIFIFRYVSGHCGC
jgi:hypothetical protein